MVNTKMIPSDDYRNKRAMLEQTEELFNPAFCPTEIT